MILAELPDDVIKAIEDHETAHSLLRDAAEMQQVFALQFLQLETNLFCFVELIESEYK
jgi:Zn-dependent protease with chaperone function